MDATWITGGYLTLIMESGHSTTETSMANSPTLPRKFGPAASRSVAEGRETDDPHVTVELGVRSISEDAQPLLDRAVEGLVRAVEEGTIDEYDVFVTGGTFTPGATAAGTALGRELSSRVADIRDWASKADATVAPYFQHEEVSCGFTGKEYTQVKFPTLCLSEYHDGELAFVAPARIDGDLVEVIDRIEALAADRSERVVAPLSE